jgi:hypothetical protein
VSKEHDPPKPPSAPWRGRASRRERRRAASSNEIPEPTTRSSVTATTQLRCFVLAGRDFRRVLDENRGVERKVMHALAARVLCNSGDPTL